MCRLPTADHARPFVGGISKVNCEGILLIFGNACSQNGSKNDKMAQERHGDTPTKGLAWNRLHGSSVRFLVLKVKGVICRLKESEFGVWSFGIWCR